MNKLKHEAICRAYEHEYAILTKRLDDTAEYFAMLLDFVAKYPHYQLEKEHKQNLFFAFTYLPWRKNLLAVVRLKISAYRSALRLVKQDGVEAWQHQ